MDPEQAAIKRAEWADMQARKDYWDAYYAKREKHRQNKLAKRERERQEHEPYRLLLSADTPVMEAAGLLVTTLGSKHVAMGAAMAQIGMRFSNTPAEHLVAVTRAALANEPAPGPAVYSFGQAAAEAAGDEDLAHLCAAELARLTAEAETQARQPGDQ
jgi:hypothetical protein